MKSIQIKTHDTIKLTETEKLTYAHLIEMTINKPPQGGFTYRDNAVRQKIENALKDAKDGVVIMEDSEFDELKKLAEEMTFPFRAIFTNEFTDALRAAKSVTPAELADLKHSENGKTKHEKVK